MDEVEYLHPTGEQAAGEAGKTQLVISIEEDSPAEVWYFMDWEG
jgi:hypothetical protein